MKFTEKQLDELNVPQPKEVTCVDLVFRGARIAGIERIEANGRIDVLAIHFDSGVELRLDAAVDVAESLDRSRVFVIEGKPESTFLIMGGVRAYWIAASGAVNGSMALFRRTGEEEYWTAQFVETETKLFFVYESGILAINETLEVRWHKAKLFNDKLVGVVEGALVFVQDEADEWRLRCEDGVILR